MHKILANSLVLVTLGSLLVGCVGDPATTQWDQAVVNLQDFAEEVDSSGDAVGAFEGISADFATLATLAEGETDSTQAMAALYGAPGAMRGKFDVELDRLARGTALSSLSAIGPARDLRDAIESSNTASVAAELGVDEATLLAQLQSFDEALNALVAKISDSGVSSPELVLLAAEGERLIAHELAHTVQQRLSSGAPLAPSLQGPSLELTGIQAKNDGVGQAGDEYEQQADALMDFYGEVFSAPENEWFRRIKVKFPWIQESSDVASRRFQTLSNASKARHDVALNAIRNMK